jgi:RNA polymerase sigma-70 factor (ECF subfamily)
LLTALTGVSDKSGSGAEARFREVFVHLPEVVAYARRRGCSDPDALAAETLTIAWRKLNQVPRDDPRPWLFATARNLLRAEWRSRKNREAGVPQPSDAPFASSVRLLDPELAEALRTLSPRDREALLLVAWEDLTPALAARALGITQAAFRVRLHRARRRLKSRLAAAPGDPALVRVGLEER